MGLFQFFRWGKKQEKGVTKGASVASCPSTPVSDVESDWQTRVGTEPGSGIPRDYRSESVSKTHRRAVRWIGPSDTAVVAGRKIGGMLYLGPEPQRKSWSHEGSAFIDPGLPVAKVGSDISGESMPYWPSYSDINPRARATYLDWLAGGRVGQAIQSRLCLSLFLRTRTTVFLRHARRGGEAPSCRRGGEPSPHLCGKPLD